VVIEFSVNGYPIQHPYRNLVNTIVSLNSRNWQIQFSHVYGEANFAADSLARVAYQYSLGTHVFLVPPLECSLFVLKDAMGCATQRSIRIL